MDSILVDAPLAGGHVLKELDCVLPAEEEIAGIVLCGMAIGAFEATPLVLALACAAKPALLGRRLY